jgi:hypothetical protein
MTEKDENRAPSDPASASLETTTTTAYDTAPEFDDLAARQRRRGAAVRMIGDNPDPLHRGRRYHRPTTGLRAAGYRQGYVAALRYVLREFASQLDDLARTKLATIIKRSGANDD